MEPGLTCHQVKLRLSKILAGVGRKTIQRIIQLKLDIPSVVRPKVPFLTEEGKEKRLRWARINRRRIISDWRGVLFADECPFQTKQTTGGRQVRRPRTANKFDPKMFTPGRSPDANPIENVFAIMKKRLETLPTRTIEEVNLEVTKVWKGLPDAYLEELCTSMRRRCTGTLNNIGYPTKY